MVHIVILGIPEEKHSKVKGERMCTHNPGVTKWKERVRPKTWLLPKCPLLFSIWMISLSWHNPLRSPRDFMLNARVSLTASQSGHCLTSQGRARRAVNEIHLRAGSNPIQSACYVAYVRFNYTTHLISHTVHAAWKDATAISHLFCTPLECWTINRIAWSCCHPDGIELKGQLR